MNKIQTLIEKNLESRVFEHFCFTTTPQPTIAHWTSSVSPLQMKSAGHLPSRQVQKFENTEEVYEEKRKYRTFCDTHEVNLLQLRLCFSKCFPALLRFCKVGYVYRASCSFALYSLWTELQLRTVGSFLFQLMNPVSKTRHLEPCEIFGGEIKNRSYLLLQ